MLPVCYGRDRRAAVLREQEPTSGSQHAAHFTGRGGGLRNRAQSVGGDDRVDAADLKRDRPGLNSDEFDREGRSRSLPLGDAADVVGKLKPPEPLDLGGIIERKLSRDPMPISTTRPCA